MTNYATVNTREELFKSIKTIWEISGIVNVNETLVQKVINRAEILLRSLQIIRLIRKQERINTRLNKHAAVLEAMNCTITSGPEYEYSSNDGCRCDCAYDEPEEVFFKPSRSSENN